MTEGDDTEFGVWDDTTQPPFICLASEGVPATFRPKHRTGDGMGVFFFGCFLRLKLV